MLTTLQQQDAFLQRVHPICKIVSLLAVILIFMNVRNPLIAIIYYGVTFVLIIVLGRIPIKVMVYVSIPIFLFGLTFIWIYAIFPAERGETILFHVLGLPIALENVREGLALSFRCLIYGSWSALFIMTTDPIMLLLGLIQQGKLPDKFGYGIMAAYRLIPNFKEELDQLQLAYSLRGVNDSRSMIGFINKIKRYSIPLLASSIRKAIRISIAMESKGFNGAKERNYYRQTHWSWRDGVYTIGFILLVLPVLL